MTDVFKALPSLQSIRFYVFELPERLTSLWSLHSADELSRHTGFGAEILIKIELDVSSITSLKTYRAKCGHNLSII